MEWRRQICLNICDPFCGGLEVVHGLVVFPERVADAAIVDQDINATIKELGCCFCSSPNVIDASKVADRGAELSFICEGLQMNFGRVLKLLLIKVEDEDFMAFLQEVSREASSNSLGSCGLLE